VIDLPDNLPNISKAKLPATYEQAKKFMFEQLRELPTKPIFYSNKIEALSIYKYFSISNPAKDVPGVYAFWEEGKCFYVGESKNLKRRLSGHPRKRQLINCSIRWLACLNHKELEAWLIQEHRPICNGLSQEREEFLIRAQKKFPKEFDEFRFFSMLKFFGFQMPLLTNNKDTK